MRLSFRTRLDVWIRISQHFPVLDFNYVKCVSRTGAVTLARVQAVTWGLVVLNTAQLATQEIVHIA